MHPTRNLFFLAIPLVSFACFCFLLVAGLSNTPATKYFYESDELTSTTRLPDFAAIDQSPERKAQFLSMLRPLVDEKNQKLLASRTRLLKIQDHLKSEGELTGVHARNLEKLRNRFHVTREKTPSDEEAVAILLERVDAIPPAMVLAQAAVESGWGTSRFAEQAHNLFGHWCYKPGCGLVPERRAANAKHEVKLFQSVEESITAYFNNINTHKAYSAWRQLRAQLRNEPTEFTGHTMVRELGSYSGRGEHYIAELRRVIRNNKLE